MADDLWDEDFCSANDQIPTDYSNYRVPQRNYNVNYHSDRISQQRNDDSRSYNQNNLFRDVGRTMNTDDDRLTGSPEEIEKINFSEDLLSSISPTQNNWRSKSSNAYTEPPNIDEPFVLRGLFKKSEEARLSKLDYLALITKKFYQEDPAVARMRPEDVKQFRSENNSISVMKIDQDAFDLAAVHSVTQEIIFSKDDDDERRALLDEFIKSMDPDDKAIVFVEKRKTAHNIANDLNIRGTKVQFIHGNRTQNQREQALNDLKAGNVKILIATSVASCEIDIKDITLIFNLYFPCNIEEYVHRIGKTGRAGRTGKAISVLTRKDSNHAADLINILKKANQYVPDELYDMAPEYKGRKIKKLADDSAAGGIRTQQRNDDSQSYNQNNSFRAGGTRMNIDAEQCSKMLIDNSLTDKFIEKGGNKIRELQDESGGNIKVIKNDFGSADTSIRLSGSSGAIEKTNLVEDLVSDMKHLSTENNWRSKSSGTNTQSLSDAKLLKKSEEARLIKLASLPPIVKNFYQEDPSVARMRPEDVKKFRSENNSISVMKIDQDDIRNIPNPVSSFKQAFNNYPELLEELKKQGFTSPSPIQSQAWPILLQGYDMIGIAQTGTGKTIAFLFPALVHIVGQITARKKRTGPSALILAPTWELAQQIESEAKRYPYKGIKSICIHGGGNCTNLSNNNDIDIIIATPGRLINLYESGIVDLSGVSYLVLDEADRMLDIGFESQIRKIIIGTREDRQTVMTSATWTVAIQELAYRYMKSPFKVKVGAFDLAAVHSVTQEIIFGEDDDDERRAVLDEFIKSMGPDDKAIVFVERKKIARNIADDLNIRGTKVQSIHGNRTHNQREQALNDLKAGNVKILIATGVASRGIDIKDITLIFNLYFPRNIEEYIHRIGRTGRAGRTGKAISVVTRKDSNHVADLIKILKEANQCVPDKLYDMAPWCRDRKDKKRDYDRDAGGR